VDGWAWHHDAEAFRRDRQRQNVLVLAGWTVLRFTWSDLTHRPDRVIHDVRTGAQQPGRGMTDMKRFGTIPGTFRRRKGR
jgi:very-short-patch-repair endonuclease